MFAAALDLPGLRQRARAASRAVALVVAALMLGMLAGGFGVALLYAWLRQTCGTLPALAIIAGGFAALSLMLLAIAGRRGRPASPRHNEADDVARLAGDGERLAAAAIDALRNGSHGSMLATLALAVLAGVALGRKV